MKVSLVFLCFANFVIIELALAQDVRRDDQYPPKQIVEKWKPHHDTCVGKTGVSEDVIKQFSDGPSVFEDENLKCYMHCMFQEQNLVLPNGKYDLVNLHELFNEDKDIHFTFIHMIRLCLYPKGDNDCQKAFSLHKCWKETDVKHYFLI